MKYIHGHIVKHSLLALYWGAVAVSGAYRERHSHKGVSPDDPDYDELNKESITAPKTPVPGPYRVCEGGTLYRPLTSKEKLQDALDTMMRQIHIVGEAVEKLE